MLYTISELIGIYDKRAGRTYSQNYKSNRYSMSDHASFSSCIAYLRNCQLLAQFLYPVTALDIAQHPVQYEPQHYNQIKTDDYSLH
jgi:hypothetical protein